MVSQVSVLDVRWIVMLFQEKVSISEVEQFCRKDEFGFGCFEFDAFNGPPNRRCPIDSWIYKSGNTWPRKRELRVISLLVVVDKLRFNQIV